MIAAAAALVREPASMGLGACSCPPPVAGRAGHNIISTAAAGRLEQLLNIGPWQQAQQWHCQLLVKSTLQRSITRCNQLRCLNFCCALPASGEPASWGTYRHMEYSNRGMQESLFHLTNCAHESAHAQLVQCSTSGNTFVLCS
jgi:hypothetical protein